MRVKRIRTDSCLIAQLNIAVRSLQRECVSVGSTGWPDGIRVLDGRMSPLQEEFDMSRMRSTIQWTVGSVVALACLAVAACTDGPTQLDQTTDIGQAIANAKGGNGGGGGGGKPPSDGPTGEPAMFNQFTGAVSTDPLLTSYTDGVSLVKADIESDGRAWLQTFDGNIKKQDIARRLCVDLSDMSSGPMNQADWDAFQGRVSDLGLSLNAVCVAATLHTRDHSNGGGQMLDMDVGDEAYSGGKIVLTELASSSRNSWEWRLIFDTFEGPSPGEGVCITHLTADTWTVANDCTAGTQTIDGTVELWRSNRGLTHVADFNFAFSLALTTDF